MQSFCLFFTSFIVTSKKGKDLGISEGFWSLGQLYLRSDYSMNNENHCVLMQQRNNPQKCFPKPNLDVSHFSPAFLYLTSIIREVILKD